MGKIWRIITLGSMILASFLLAFGSSTIGKESYSFSQTRSIRIQDDWTGYSSLAPIEAHYFLERNEDKFSGEVHFSVAGYSEHPKTTTENIEIPLEVVQAFLEMLAKSPLDYGEYVPEFTHTDDYPDIRIELESDSESITFFTTSQGADHVPWAAILDGKTYVVDSDIPAKALAILEPFLKRDVLESLLKSV